MHLRLMKHCFPSGTLQIRYNLGGLREPFTISLNHRNMANGQPHKVNITRQDRLIQLQVLYLYLAQWSH